MQKYDYLIIGGGIAGVTAAETLRARDAHARIGIVSDEPHVLYSRVLIPAYLKRKIKREQLFLRTPEQFIEKGIDMYLQEHVARMPAGAKTVQLESGVTLAFEKLLIATGGKVKPWGKPEDQNYIYRLHTLDDADRLLAAIDAQQITRPLVIGASFISLEFLEIFLLNNSTPSLLAHDSHFFAHMLDAQGAELIHDNLQERGVSVQFKDEVAHITKTGRALRIMTSGLRQIDADACAVGIGIERNREWLAESGIALGEKGIRTNEFLETNQEGIYAAGDSAEFYDTVTDRTHVTGNWTNAFLQGTRAGLNMAGQREAFRTVATYSITNLGYQITALGDMSPEYETIARIDPTLKQYERFFIKKDYIVGAALINRFQDRNHLSQLILNHTPIGAYKTQLGKMEFDIQTIAPLQ